MGSSLNDKGTSLERRWIRTRQRKVVQGRGKDKCKGLSPKGACTLRGVERKPVGRKNRE